MRSLTVWWLGRQCGADRSVQVESTARGDRSCLPAARTAGSDDDGGWQGELAVGEKTPMVVALHTENSHTTNSH